MRKGNFNDLKKKRRSIVLNWSKLREIDNLEYTKFFNEDGREDKATWIGMIREYYMALHEGRVKEAKINLEEMVDYQGRKTFCKLLYEAVGIEGLIAMWDTVSSGRTYSGRKYKTIYDIVKETNRIINDPDYRRKVRTPFALRIDGYNIGINSEFYDKYLSDFYEPIDSRFYNKFHKRMKRKSCRNKGLK